MRSLRTATSVFLTLSIAAPAGAQIVGRPDYGRVEAADPFLGNGYMPGPGLGRELRDIHQRIDRARRSGAITGREARQLRREAAVIAHLGHVYRNGGVSGSERQELRTRVDVLRDTVNRQGANGTSGHEGRGR